jgi:hypothetical protein
MLTVTDLTVTDLTESFGETICPFEIARAAWAMLYKPIIDNTMSAFIGSPYGTSQHALIAKRGLICCQLRE